MTKRLHIREFIALPYDLELPSDSSFEVNYRVVRRNAQQRANKTNKSVFILKIVEIVEPSKIVLNLF